MRSWLIPALLSLSLALPPGAVAPAVVAGGLILVADSAPAEARARTRSSGGYARPSTRSRTPSLSIPSSPRSSSSGSGGYRRPSLSPSPGIRTSPSLPSAADREFSRRQSGEALNRYRADRQPNTPSQTYPAPVPSGPPPGARRHGQADEWAGYRNGGVPSGSGWGTSGWGGSSWGWGTRRSGGWGSGWASGWPAGRGWTLPGYAYNTPSRFGIWDGLFLWFLLDNLSRAGSTDFFHNHRNDPGYEQWRAEAERRAQSDADLRARLDQLDRQLAEKQGQPTNPNYLPPDTPRDVAVAEDAVSEERSSDLQTPAARPGNSQAAQPPVVQPRAGADEAENGGGMGGVIVILALLVGGGVLFLLWRSRRRHPLPAGAAPSSSPTGMAGRILRNTVSGETYKPSLFRVGMTLTADPTPFILAGGSTKVAPPEGGSGGLVSVEAVGRLTAGGTTLHRLYLPGGQSFFQLHLGADGKPDECRYFSLIDEVSPASEEEWGFWLDTAEGMIGWPEFQTKDGKSYARQWAPGSNRIAPRDLSEVRSETGGERTRRLSAMLYAAPTGAAAPAPETEYILVAAVEADGQAWVEIQAGIDVNPAALSLA
ncbi:DUF2491 family protein [Azospirillum sp. SYSU D00513]|uniref:DUF2491 family protein n=1 Tax=Azospirillum sp. SYSU D00513 TaxID=2812561 RepID=UPI001A963A55|nr:DUF2491 family protein [Azospirillum sp. SYSU D00513]